MLRSASFRVVAGLDFASPLSAYGRPIDRPTTETGKSARLRLERRDVWRSAEAVVRYWRTRMEAEDAIARVQGLDLPEGRYHPPVDPNIRQSMVEKWRAALMRQLLTAAPDAQAVAWKQAELARGQHRQSDVAPGRIEQAIAADKAWLAAHPTRRSNSEAMARSREFKEAMRRRIRGVAADRGLSDTEIKPT